MMRNITVGITDCGKYENYHRWIAGEQNVEIVRLSYHERNLEQINICDGIILSGGEDVHPQYYNKRELIDLCHEIDERRDEFEWKVLEHIAHSPVPLLGICRGLQIANVFYGGTLLPHIPLSGKFDHSRYESADRYHIACVDPNSKLRSIIGDVKGEINSAHHQAADRIGDGLVANVISPDGVVEGLERLGENDDIFFQLVQWHPERMTNLKSHFSRNIRDKFLEAARRSKERSV